jgi:uncharacterized RDD family membrane protein YckC
VPPPPPPPPPGWGSDRVGSADEDAPLLEYASFVTRLGGLVVDSVIGFLAGAPGWLLLRAAGDDGGALFLAGSLLLVGGIVAWLVVYAVMMGRSGQSPGCKVMGMKVVDRRTLGPIGPGRAVGRYLFASFISGSIFYLGYLWMLWDENKQTWQDKVVGSIVLKA